MGLFSFLSKNKQDSSGQASGHFSRADDDAFAESARSKRASHAGEGAGRRKGGVDPVLPEKKRARRRLVGSIALALAAAVGLPMLLDSEPKPLAGDIAIQIPSKDKAPPLPAPADPAPADPAPADPAPAPAAVAAADSVDQGEEIVAPAPAKPAAGSARDVAEVKLAEAPKAEPAKPEPKASAKPDTKAETKPDTTPARPKADDKPAPAKDDAGRALAILEGKQADKQAAGQKYVLQVAALASQEKAAELQARLREAGIRSYTQKLARPNGQLIRVKVGPFSREEAEKVRAQLGKLGLSGTLVPA